MPSDNHESGRTDPWETGTAPAWLPPLAASIAAVGNPERPHEQLLTLQSAIGRLIHLATVAVRLRPKLRFNALPSLRFR
jgi:hypothetical protein